MAEHPDACLVVQFFCLERKKLLHLSIKEDLIPKIPKFNWGQGHHQVLKEVLVEPAVHPACMAHIVGFSENLGTISHKDYVEVSAEWSLARHEELLAELDFEGLDEDSEA